MSSDREHITKERLIEIVRSLWTILDEIDTASDIAKGNEKWYAERVKFLQNQRWKHVFISELRTMEMDV